MATATRKAAAVSGSAQPAEKSGKDLIPDSLKGVLFNETAPEVQGAESARKGKAPNPLNPVVVEALNAMVAAKREGTILKARFVGTNYTVRSDLKGTANKWTKALELKGTIVKVHYVTISGTPSPSAKDNDKNLTVGYYVELVSKDEKTTA